MEYPCEIIQDLLPLYHDSVCSNQTRAAVEEHLQACSGCQAAYQALLRSDQVELQEPSDLDRIQGATIKKVRKNLRQRTAKVSLAVLLAVCITLTGTLIWLNVDTISLPPGLIWDTGRVHGKGETNFRFSLDYDVLKGSKYYSIGSAEYVGVDIKINMGNDSYRKEKAMVFSKRITRWQALWYDLTGPEEDIANNSSRMEMVSASWAYWRDKYYGDPPPISKRQNGTFFTQAYYVRDCTVLDKLPGMTPEERAVALAQTGELLWADYYDATH